MNGQGVRLRFNLLELDKVSVFRDDGMFSLLKVDSLITSVKKLSLSEQDNYCWRRLLLGTLYLW